VKLPDTPNYEPSNDGKSPLAKVEDWVNVRGEITEKGTVKLSENGSQKFTRETSTMPNWAGSSWYWLRFMDAKNEKEAWSKEAEEYWGPVDLYVGGAEHAVLHLLYGRFWHKVLYDLGLVSTKEPFKKLVNQGLIMAEDGRKMSKSLGNVVNPDDVVKAFGADTLRMYEMFMGPLEDTKPWNTSSIAGVRRFLERVWKLQDKLREDDETNTLIDIKLNKLLHQTVKKVTQDIEKMRFNTAISQMMIFVNNLEKEKKIIQDLFEKFLILLSPFAPHMAEELWQRLGHKKSIIFAKWPEYDKNLIQEDEIEMVVQINGKVRDKIKVLADISEQEAKQKALASEKVQKWLDGKEPKKVIYIKGKLVSMVV